MLEKAMLRGIPRPPLKSMSEVEVSGVLLR
jgi:hypothetical protein